MKTNEEWVEYCEKNITAGYTPLGRKGNVYLTGLNLVKMLKPYINWKPGDTIVDIGCGNGRWAFGLLKESIRYYGIDCIKPCIDFCSKAFAEFENYHFFHVDVKNGHYWSIGKIAPEDVVYPLESKSADLIIAHSLFSHAGTIRAAERNLEEMGRILKPDGILYSTWYLSPPKKKVNRGEKETVFAREEFNFLMKYYEVYLEFLQPMGEQIAFLARLKKR